VITYLRKIIKNGEKSGWFWVKNGRKWHKMMTKWQKPPRVTHEALISNKI
jgi:hypothetical protein